MRLQLIQHKFRRIARLHDFFALHRTRCVENENHIFRHHLLLFHLHFRIHEEQEKAVGTRIRFVRQKRRANCIFGNTVIKDKIAVGFHVRCFVTDARVKIVFARNGNIVRRRINCLERGSRFQIHIDAHTAQRLRRKFFRRKRVHIFHQPVFRFQNLRVRNVHAFFAVRRNRKNARLERAASDIFQQRGIALPPHDAFINLARLFAVQDLALQTHAIYVHREIGNCRVVGQRKNVRAFQNGIAVIHKNLIYFCSRDLIFNCNGNVMIFYAQVRGANARVHGNDTARIRRTRRRRRHVDGRTINDHQPIRRYRRGIPDPQRAERDQCKRNDAKCLHGNPPLAQTSREFTRVGAKLLQRCTLSRRASDKSFAPIRLFVVQQSARAKETQLDFKTFQ